MKCAVVYVSKGGNTEKLARAVARGAGVQAQPLSGIRALDTPVDLLFIGASIYAGRIDGAMRSFLQTVSAGQVKRVAVFGSACGAKSALAEAKAILEPRGIPVLDEAFQCRGAFLFLNSGRPNDGDLEAATAFAKRLCAL
ncbi:MAG: flavodoxin [Spirochaetaceae bacterium]|nr:flavodoxin [Spirochaetaceae bacterium]